MTDDSDYNSDYNSDGDINLLLKKSFDKKIKILENQSINNMFIEKFNGVKVKAFNLNNEIDYLELKINDILFSKRYYIINGKDFKRLSKDGKIIFYSPNFEEINLILSNVQDERLYFIELL